MRSRVFNSTMAIAMAVALGVSVAAQAPQGGAPAPGAQAPPGGAPGQGQGRAGGGGRGGGRGFNLPPLLMETDAFPDGGIVPPKYVSAGGNPSVLPGFKISNAPAGTVSYAVIFHDIDVALNNGTGDVLHWIAWNIPASANGWPEGMLPAGSVQGNNMRNQANYMGPGAPAGPRYHHYVFELYALNANLDLPATTSRDDLLKALQGKVVAKAAYVGRFRGEPAAGGAPAGGPPAGRGNQ
jgi:Raf kinase inhibitor-like YbhB/YbcL family protein